MKGSYHNLAALADGGGMKPLQQPHPHPNGVDAMAVGGGGGMRRMPGHASTFSASSPLSPLSHGPVAEQEERAEERMMHEGGTPKQKKAEEQG